jgi:ligand-binding sensor domain-containing protein
LPISIAESSDRTVWIGTRDAGLLRFHDGRVSNLEGIPDRKINAMVPGPDRDLWIGTDNGVAHWNGVALSRDSIPAPLLHVQVLQ